MGQWIERRSNNFSATLGPLVEPNQDRIAVFIANLGPNPITISTEPADVNNAVGIPIAVNETQEFRWSAHGNLARCIWYLTSTSASQLICVFEEIYYAEGELNVAVER